MNSIELTAKHRKQLLEMANSLFKDDDWRFSLDAPKGYNNNHTFVIGFIEDNDYIPNCDCYIHWFEFCFRFLVNKIQSKMTDGQAWRPMPLYAQNFLQGTQWTMWSEFMFHYPKQIGKSHDTIPSHPITYLYTQFKLLKT